MSVRSPNQRARLAESGPTRRTLRCGCSRSAGRKVPHSRSPGRLGTRRASIRDRGAPCIGVLTPATLTVAGNGQYEWLVEQARKYKVLKAVTFVGRVDHEGLVQLLHSADAAVLPSHYEPFGIVALEAAATGTPLVTSNVGGLGEAVINGQTGMSYPPRDIAAMARAVRAVLDDPKAAQQRAIAARERLTSDFDWHTVADETAQVYLAAKRGERQPHPRRLIVEHALPDR